MTMRRPPTAARWLLAHLTRPNDALDGDLVEEYQRRRSRGWYWRQVILAIGVDFVQAVSSHRLATVRAILIGVGASTVLSSLAIAPFERMLSAIAMDYLGVPIRTWSNGLYYITYPVWGFAGVATGWVVARFSDSSRMAMVQANVAFLVLWNLPELLRVTSNALSHPRYLKSFLMLAGWTLMMSVALLVGGILSDDHRKAERPIIRS